MNVELCKVFALTWLLASCASTPRSASMAPSHRGRAQLATVEQNPGATLRPVVTTQRTRSAAPGACALVPEIEQNVCPLLQTPVLGIRQLVRPLDPKGNWNAPAGAVVYSLAAPGLTPEWLGHLIECYQARVADRASALGARESCPLAEPESNVSITPTGNGFAVSIRSPDSESAKRIFDESERFAPSAPQLAKVAVRQ